MSRYPGAVWRPLPGKTTGRLTPDLLCLHTMVGYLKSTDSYFRQAAVFSHFGIGGIWGSDNGAGLDGTVWQWQDTTYRAAANLNGNYRIISVETADNAARPIAPWTPAQEEAIVGLMVWAHREHGIPLVLLPDSRPGRRGVAYHELGCDPARVDGGERWSTAYGKDCPTNVRISRIPGLVQRARSIILGATPPPIEKRYFVDATDEAKFRQLVDERIDAKFSVTGTAADGVAQRSRQVLADGRLPYGLDSLRSLIAAGNAGVVRVLEAQGLDTARIVAEIDANEALIRAQDMGPAAGV